MITGNGSFILSQRDTGGGSPAPPFDPTSADNGLSVDAVTGRIVLGDDIGGALADLLSDRQIEMGGNLFKFINGGSDILLLDPANDTYIIGDINQTYLYNDAFGFEISSGGVPSVGMNVMDFTFGDYNNTQNKTYLDIDDTNEIIRFFFGSDPYFVLDNATQNWAIGDYNNFVKPVIGLYSTVNADGIYLEAHNGNDAVLTLDTGGGTTNYPQIEAQVREGGITTRWVMNDLNYFIQDDNGYKIYMDFFTDVYQFGDCDTFPAVGIGNGTHMAIDDAASTFYFKNTANNAAININGVAGFTGTVTPVNSITVNNGIVTAVS